MKILVDIVHLADINFYKNAVKKLQDEGHEVSLVMKPRGKIADVLKKEYSLPFTVVGNTYNTELGKIFGIIVREWLLLKYLISHKVDVVTSFNFYMGLAASILGKRSIIFYDDYEYRKQFNLRRIFSTKFVIPKGIPVNNKKIVKYNGFKELAYLHPNYFKAKRDILKEYNLKENKYVFVREISPISLNYNKSNIIELTNIFKYLNKKGFKIVLSLENKALYDKFKSYCILLKEPVRDIYSLMYYSAFMISSGDTMVREAALLGVPAIYTGGRKMCVNNNLVEKGAIIEVKNQKEVLDRVEAILRENLKREVRKVINKAVKEEWEDTTKVIVENITGR